MWHKMAGEGSPPPKGAFWLLDRITPASGKELQLHEIPNILGEMYLYGRETDREARLEFVTVKSADYERKLEVLAQLVGEHCGDVAKEEPIGQSRPRRRQCLGSGVCRKTHRGPARGAAAGETAGDEPECLAGHAAASLGRQAACGCGGRSRLSGSVVGCHPDPGRSRRTVSHLVRLQ
jgi:hypothetical protein